MIQLHHPSTLGLLTRDGVTLRCHFAFRDYAGTAPVHWGRLRVLNRIELDADAAFRLANERSVEIVTLVLDGTVVVRVDGLGDSLLQPGDCHVVSAGDGIGLATWQAGGAPAALLQLWLLPEEEGGEPEIGLRRDADRSGHEHILLASGFPEDDPEETDQGRSGDPLPLKARARVLRIALPAGGQAVISTRADRSVYALVVAGRVDILGRDADVGCGAAVTGCETVIVRALEPSHLVVCDSD
ncbi:MULTISPECIES: pirin family protein [Nguyenibacter]|uniref:Pirin family protein n=1 Tax=Nguyenibacter vanlangensis TaxID=1216886 RepID=A0A7Y7M5R4_9PROT|nr:MULTISPECIES: pirin family protein [Nguyenibacter]NVN11302.1 pirin family protein [Nguyenibacter vanlangensis]WRH89055.1 pirin family protein [Nguyenibacter sp. L1]